MSATSDFSISSARHWPMQYDIAIRVKPLLRNAGRYQHIEELRDFKKLLTATEPSSTRKFIPT